MTSDTGPVPSHPIADLLLAAWRGPRPAVDGSWMRAATWRAGTYGVVAITGRAIITAPEHVSDADLAAYGADGWGHAHDPRLISWLAGRDGWIDVLDAVLIAPGTGADPHSIVAGLTERPDLRAHPRVRHALPIRDDVRIYGLPGDDETLLTIARGLGGLTELSFEVGADRRGSGLGTALALAARTLVPAGKPLLACVSPANVPSVRALLRAGFEPVGSVQLYRPGAESEPAAPVSS